VCHTSHVACLTLDALLFNTLQDDFQEAAYILQEIADKFGVTTPILANALAVARLQEGNYDKAMELLQRCVEQEQSSNAVSIINLIATLEQGGKQVHVSKCLE
jgi:tetratricopeptide (TPR) repeat protein